MAEAVSHELEMRFALMTDGASIGVNVAPAIVEAFFVFATKAIRGVNCIPSVFATEDRCICLSHSTNTMFQIISCRP